MPKDLERKLEREGKQKGLTGKSLRAYIYGTLRRTGWKPGTPRTRKEKTRKGGAR